MRIALVALAFAFTSACDSASPISRPGGATGDAVTLRVDRTQVRRGETVDLVLTNENRRSINLGNLSCAVVERLDGGVWTSRPADNPHGCTFELYVLPQDETLRARRALDVEPGTVRFGHGFEFEGGGGVVWSPPVRVLH